MMFVDGTVFIEIETLSKEEILVRFMFGKMSRRQGEDWKHSSHPGERERSWHLG